MWYMMYCGAPAPSGCHGHWTGRGKPTAWPLCMSDVNPRFLPIKSSCVEFEAALNHYVVDGFQAICYYDGIFEQILGLMSSVEVCIKSCSRHCEHLLQMYSFQL
jgi:hypothetical protein